MTTVQTLIKNKSAVKAAMSMAREVATPESLTQGGWIRIGKVASMTDPSKSYQVAIRPTATEKGFQFGCSCPHWIHRCNKNGTTCKHQDAVLATGVTPKTPSGKVKVWWNLSGEAFVQALAAFAH